MDRTRAVNRFKKSSQIDSWTNRRDPAMHACPWLWYAANRDPWTAAARSASANTMFGPFPPSSRRGFFNVSAPARMMSCPTSTDPVKQIFAMSGWRASLAPATEPFPGTTLIVPGGKPASTESRATSMALIGVYSAGFRTTVFPAARAGAMFQATNMRGKFQGTIWPTTPDRPLEFPPHVRRLEHRPSPRGGEHGRPETGRIHADERHRGGAALRRRGLSSGYD